MKVVIVIREGCIPEEAALGQFRAMKTLLVTPPYLPMLPLLATNFSASYKGDLVGFSSMVQKLVELTSPITTPLSNVSVSPELSEASLLVFSGAAAIVNFQLPKRRLIGAS